MVAGPNVTALLLAHRQGEPDALPKIIPLVYDELRAIASRYLRSERTGHTLQPTALVHEAYLRLVDQNDPRWENRAHFLGCAAQVMRHILVDHARARRTKKRGGSAIRVTLAAEEAPADVGDVDLVALDDALAALAALSERQAKVVELKYFGGLTNQEAATVLGISEAVVRRDWTLARAWLRRELTRGPSR